MEGLRSTVSFVFNRVGDARGVFAASSGASPQPEGIAERDASRRTEGTVGPSWFEAARHAEH